MMAYLIFILVFGIFNINMRVEIWKLEGEGEDEKWKRRKKKMEENLRKVGEMMNGYIMH